MKSPCIKVCRIDKGMMPENGGLCIGCFRTLDEIACWGSQNEAGQARIMAAVAGRREQHDPWAGELRGDCDRE